MTVHLLLGKHPVLVLMKQEWEHSPKSVLIS